METALSYHGWIAEAVYVVTSASLGRSREFEMPLGRCSFARVPQKVFYSGVTRIEKSFGDLSEPSLHAGESFMMASPPKALTDYVYVHRLDWSSAHPIIESLRVDRSSLSGIVTEEFDRLLSNYTSRRVLHFLEGLRKDLNR